MDLVIIKSGGVCVQIGVVSVKVLLAVLLSAPCVPSSVTLQTFVMLTTFAGTVELSWTVTVRVIDELPARPTSLKVTTPLANEPFGAETKVVFAGIVSVATTPVVATPLSELIV